MTATTSGEGTRLADADHQRPIEPRWAPYNEMTDGVPSPTDSGVPDTQHVRADRRVIARTAGR